MMSSSQLYAAFRPCRRLAIAPTRSRSPATRTVDIRQCRSAAQNTMQREDRHIAMIAVDLDTLTISPPTSARGTTNMTSRFRDDATLEEVVSPDASLP